VIHTKSVVNIFFFVQESKAKDAVELQRSESLEALVEVSTGQDDEVKPVTATKREVEEEWAVNIDVNAPVDDFYKRVPDMAYQVSSLMSLPFPCYTEL